MSPNLDDAAVYCGWTRPGSTADAMKCEGVLNRCTVLVYAIGNKQVHAVVLDGTVKTVSWPLEEQRCMAPMTYKEKPYPVARAVRMLKRAGKTLGISAPAARVLGEMS